MSQDYNAEEEDYYYHNGDICKECSDKKYNEGK